MATTREPITEGDIIDYLLANEVQPLDFPREINVRVYIDEALKRRGLKLSYNAAKGKIVKMVTDGTMEEAGLRVCPVNGKVAMAWRVVKQT